MDFRVLVLSLLLWLIPFGASAIDQLDELTELVYQYPSKALTQITALEKQFTTSATSDINRLRLSVLKCQNLLQLGENEAAINVAQLGEANAKQLKLDQVRPYFLICQDRRQSQLQQYSECAALAGFSHYLSATLSTTPSLSRCLAFTWSARYQYG
ncbi:hypothetical protein P4S55_10105 [Shewanella sp. PP-Sp27a-2]